MIRYSRIEEELEQKGSCSYFNTGTSMMPLLRQRRDLIHLEAPYRRPVKNDVVLVRSSENSYILHRVQKVTKRGYTLCGDHCVRCEKNIDASRIVGILTGFTRDGRYISTQNILYRIYVKLWGGRYWYRIGILYVSGRIRGIAAKVKAKIKKSYI